MRQTMIKGSPLIYPNKKWESLNTNDPNNDNYSIINTLTDKDKGVDGKYHFKMVWPNVKKGPNFQEWKQSSNPINTKTVTGYEPVTINYTMNWDPDGGLAKKGQYDYDPLLSAHNNYYAIGQPSPWDPNNQHPNGIQGFNDIPVSKVELYIIS